MTVVVATFRFKDTTAETLEKFRPDFKKALNTSIKPDITIKDGEVKAVYKTPHVPAVIARHLLKPLIDKMKVEFLKGLEKQSEDFGKIVGVKPVGSIEMLE